MLKRNLFSSIHSLANKLNIVPSTAHYHLTDLLHFRPLRLRWVPYDLTDELRAMKIAKAKKLFNLLDRQKLIEYSDILTDDEL
jgi:hypothetical protein